MADGLLDAYFGNPNLQRQGARARALAKQRDVNLLADPKTYAVVQGLLGNAPDQLGFSVLNPKYQEIKQTAEPAFVLGSLLQAAPLLAPMTKGLPVGASIKNVSKIDEATGLPLNSDGTVTLFHHTNKAAAEQIQKTGKLKSAGEPSVYLTTQKTADTGYGDVVVPIRVKPSLLNLDDEFPNGRMDFSIDTKKPKGSVPVTVEKQSFQYPQEEAMLLAQQRAALPVEQGGLGLPANNTAMDRAEAMGFDTPAYHGTNRDFNSFSNTMLGANTGAKSAKGAHFAASSPDTANSYVKSGDFLKDDAPALEALFKQPGAWEEYSSAPTNQDRWAVLEKYGLSYGQGRVIPLQLNMQRPRIKDYKGEVYRDTTYADEIAAAKKGKKDSVIFKSTYDGGGESQAGMSDIYAVMSPDQIRSRFAAFDPFRKTAATAALMGVAAPDLLAQEVDYTLLPPEKKKELLQSLLGQ